MHSTSWTRAGGIDVVQGGVSARRKGPVGSGGVDKVGMAWLVNAKAVVRE